MTLDATVEFKDVPGFSGYRVGSDGTVWSCKRKAAPNRGWELSDRWRQLRRKVNVDGYNVVTLFIDGKRFHKRCAVLVLEAFVGPRPAGMKACHDNKGIRSDDHLRFLRWGTATENMADMRKHGTVRLGEKNAAARLTSDQVLEIRASKLPTEELSSMFGVSKVSINNVKRRHTWSHI